MWQWYAETLMQTLRNRLGPEVAEATWHHPNEDWGQKRVPEVVPRWDGHTAESLCSSAVFQHCRGKLGVGISILQCYLRTACQRPAAARARSLLSRTYFLMPLSAPRAEEEPLQWQPSPNSVWPSYSCVQKLQEVSQSQEQRWKKATWVQE